MVSPGFVLKKFGQPASPLARQYRGSVKPSCDTDSAPPPPVFCKGNNILDKSNGLGYYLACEERHEHQTKDSPTSRDLLRQPRQLPQVYGEVALAGWRCDLPHLRTRGCRVP